MNMNHKKSFQSLSFRLFKSVFDTVFLKDVEIGLELLRLGDLDFGLGLVNKFYPFIFSLCCLCQKQILLAAENTIRHLSLQLSSEAVRVASVRVS